MNKNFYNGMKTDYSDKVIDHYENQGMWVVLSTSDCWYWSCGHWSVVICETTNRSG